jgi:hypothetical protein
MNLSTSAIVARNTEWSGLRHTEPYEAGWATEAIVFVRALKAPRGGAGRAHVEISGDGMTWVRDGTSFDLPQEKDAVTFARIAHFGSWLRIAADIPDDGIQTLLVTLHLKG